MGRNPVGGIGPKKKYMGQSTKSQCQFKKPSPAHLKEVNFRPCHSRPSLKAWVIGPKDERSWKFFGGQLNIN